MEVRAAIGTELGVRVANVGVGELLFLVDVLEWLSTSSSSTKFVREFRQGL